MVAECSLSFLRKTDKHNSAVFFTPFSDYIFLIYQTIDGRGQGACRYAQFFCHNRHGIPSGKTDCLNDMHIVVGYILEFVGYNRFFFQLQYFVK